MEYVLSRRDLEDFYLSLLKLHSTFQREVHELATAHHLSANHLDFLLVGARLGGVGDWIPLKAVYPYFPVTQPAVGRLARYLAYWGYIELARDRADRRQVHFRLLSPAWRLLELFRDRQRQLIQREGVDPGFIRALNQSLRKRIFALTCESPNRLSKK